MEAIVAVGGVVVLVVGVLLYLLWSADWSRDDAPPIAPPKGSAPPALARPVRRQESATEGQEIATIDLSDRALAVLDSGVTPLRREASAPVVADPPLQREAEADLPFDDMRRDLQKIAYGMVRPGVSAEERERFKRGMIEFSRADPLVRQIADQVRSIAAQSPGILQSEIYVFFPSVGKEQVRSAIYFAVELGWLHRFKKGRSYSLYPPGETIEGRRTDG